MLKYACAIKFRYLFTSIILSFLVLVEQCSADRVCEPLTTPYRGEISGDCSGTTSGGICEVSCHEPYKLLGPRRRVCNQTAQRWLPKKEQMCIDPNNRCSKIRPPSNGYFIDDCDNRIGYMCKIGCVTGYDLIGSWYRYCSELKTWEPKQPKCRRKKCPVLRAPEYGSVIGSCWNFVGYTCQFHCDAGYRLVGSYKRRCLATGRWGGAPARCLKLCPSIPPIKDGEFRGDCNPGIPGRICRVLCRRGYQLDRDYKFITCFSNGSWSLQPPKCKLVQCPSLPPPTNGSFQGNCRPGYYGRPCIFTCRNGYWLDGSKSIVCQANGGWSSHVPVCQTAGSLKGIFCPDVEPGTIYQLRGTCKDAVPGDWCHVQCSFGLESLRESKNITCLRTGSWSASRMICESNVRCKKPKRPKNGFLKNCKLELGSICEQYCKSGFAGVGTSYRRCMLDGKWEGKRLRCFKLPARFLIPSLFEALYKR